MQHTLRFKLLVFFLLITFIPMIIVGIIGYYNQKEELTNSVEQMLMMNSEIMSVEIEKFIEERITNTRYLARNPILMDQESDTWDMRVQIHQFLDVHQIYQGVVFADVDGRVVIDGDGQTVDNDISNREWFQRAVSGELYFSDIYMSPLLRFPVIVMASPVYDEDKNIIGVVSPYFNIDALNETIDKYTLQQREIVGSEGYAFLINRSGEIISHPNDDFIFHNNYFVEYGLSPMTLAEMREMPAFIEIPNLEEVHAFSKVKNMPGFHNDWYLGIAIDQNQLYYPLSRLLKQYVFFIGLVLLLITIAVFKLANYLVKPIQQLVETTAAFASGKKIEKVPQINAYKEMDQLNQTFYEMTRKLEKREQDDKKSTLILETTDNGVLAVNKLEKRITLFNRTCELLFEEEKDTVLGKTMGELLEMSPNFRSFVEEATLLQQIEEVETEKTIEIECNCNGGKKYFLISISTLPSLEDETRHDEILLVFHDLTEIRLMEKKLVRSEKLKIVGQISAGLAHEIKNPLTTIRGFVQLLGENKESKNIKHYDLIIKEIDRVNGIINDLLNIAKPKVNSEENTYVNVKNLINDILLLTETQMKNKNIRVFTSIDEEMPLIFTKESKLKQVLINLVQNAEEALGDDGGKLRIHASYHWPMEDLIITITDTGIGMDPQTVEQLGIPFFTTKKDGTGLGLTTSFQIIEDMGGTITVSSEKGEGTTFEIRLPNKKQKR
ncbi:MULTISPECIES: PAS domain-containing sensor histidine kinase [Bacillaceae]|uniref:histidine kinase n=1 Tax=Evansella alkalicola TaxID=745819 RepID=A0ABS6K293_9BACI|nr:MULTISPECIES: PAS domain-containing sensor histidine kinase [Bacillaceae]MBU9724289.1 PAS domain-containing protein [Bacillus alkalicola]